MRCALVSMLCHNLYAWYNEIFSFASLKTYGKINYIILSNIYLTRTPIAIACNFQHLRNILCLHSSVLFSSVTGKISQPVHLGQPMTLSCNSNQVKKLLKLTLKFLKFSLLVSALSNHRATKTPRCSILTLSLTAAGLSIFCITRQNASKNFSECLETFQKLFRLFRKIYVLFGFYFHLNFVDTRKNFMGKKLYVGNVNELFLPLMLLWYCAWCIIRLTAERSKK